MDGSSIIDRSLKALARRAAPAFVRLAGLSVEPSAIRWEDVTVSLPELRADQVLLVGEADDPKRWGMHLEFQLVLDRRVLPDWFFKNAAFTRQLGHEVLLTVIYLRRGRRVQFPNAYTAQRGRVKNRYEFDTIRLWEHAGRIRSGELQELAPLLVLCENTPTIATLQEERTLIRELAVPPEMRGDLLAIAVMVGTRYFGRELLLQLFREEMQMLKEASIIQDWLSEIESEARGEARGRAEGEARGTRRVVLRVLREWFGEPPPSLVRQIEEGSADWCEELAVRARTAKSLQDLGL